MARPNGSRKVRGWIITPKVAEQAGVSLTKELSKEDMEKLLAARRDAKPQDAGNKSEGAGSFAGKEIKDSSGTRISFSEDGSKFRYYSSGGRNWSQSLPITKEQGSRLATGKARAADIAKEAKTSLVRNAMGGAKPQRWMSRKAAFDTTPFKAKQGEAFTLILDRIVRSKGDTLRIGRTDFVIDRVNKPSKKSRFGTMSLTAPDGDKYKRDVGSVVNEIERRILKERNSMGEPLPAFELISR